MAKAIGEPIGLCACGCGGILYEKIYHYESRGGKPIVRRPTILTGHAKPPEHWTGRKDMVPSEPIWRLLVRFKEEHGLLWREVSDLVGYTYRVHDMRYHRYVSKVHAEGILRAIRKYHIDQLSNSGR